MKIALDWTPNPMHTGLFVAKHKSWLDLTCISPSADRYTVMPSDKLLRGEVDFCIGPPEGLIDHYQLAGSPQLLAVAPILRENTSAFVAGPQSGIRTTGQWAGKRYATLELPFERGLLTAVTEVNGENGPEVFAPAKLDTWKMLLEGETDLTWIFLPVEGAEAAYEGISLTVFRPEEFGIPYPPCPIIQTSGDFVEAEPAGVGHFLEMAARGYQFAVDYPEEAARILGQYLEEELHPRKLTYIQKAISPYYYLTGGASHYPSEALAVYTDWLWSRGLLTKRLDADSMLWK
jgi:ABC-type nitrate/sulfonate/bicarbonate transport system substrate-binding protein